MFKMNGKNYKSILAIARAIGKARIYRKDFERFGITEINADNAGEITPIKTAEEVKFEEFKTAIKGLSVIAFKKALKAYSIDELEDFVTRTGRNKWEKLENYAIRRMRLIMELKAEFYPEYRVKTSASSSPWGRISTETLIKKAEELKACWEDCENIGIKRMRLIMALKAFGIKPESFPA